MKKTTWDDFDSLEASASEIDGSFSSKQELLYNSLFQSSSLNSRANYEDTDSSLHIENWDNLNAWANSEKVQVSENKLYSIGTAGSGSGINHAISLGDSDTLRAVCKINFNTGLSSGGLGIGISTDTAGGVPAIAMGNAYGLYFNNSTMKQIKDGALTELDYVQSRIFGEYLVSIIIDLKYISVIANSITDGITEYAMRMDRSGISINNLFIFTSDSRGLTGISVSQLGYRKGLQTISPRLNIEDIYKTTQWTGDGTQNFKIYLPKEYDSRKTYPCVIGFHGNGSYETYWSSNTNMRNVQKALVDSGYIFLACSYSSPYTWGNSYSTTAYYKAYKYLLDNYSVNNIGFYANSMGGIESLNALAIEQIPCSAWVSTSATTNLRDNYDNLFNSAIKSAYGIATGGADYDEKTNGRDPMLLSNDKFRGVPMLFISATDDAAVLTENNTDLFISKVSNHVKYIEKVTVATGGHSFNNSPYLTNITAFFNKYLKNIY